MRYLNLLRSTCHNIILQIPVVSEFNPVSHFFKCYKTVSIIINLIYYHTESSLKIINIRYTDVWGNLLFVVMEIDRKIISIIPCFPLDPSRQTHVLHLQETLHGHTHNLLLVYP